MGLSSSQARLLNLTSRMHQIEYKAARLEAEKLQMANESDRVYEDYLDALDATKIQYSTLTTDGAITYLDATYNNLCMGYISNGTILTNSSHYLGAEPVGDSTILGKTTGKGYLLVDSESGAVYVPEYVKNIYNNSADATEFANNMVEYINGNATVAVDTTPSGDDTTPSGGQDEYVLAFGQTINSIQVEAGNSKTIKFNNVFDNNKEYSYSVTSNSDTSLSVTYGKNGRLSINGSDLKIVAQSDQADDIILIGNNNELDTGDGDDKIRVGLVADSNISVSSSNNKIIAGTGNDYIQAVGNNTVKGGAGTDSLLILGPNTNDGVENIFSAQSTQANFDNKVGWTMQGGCGNCRALSLINSMGNGINSYIGVEKNGDDYKVTFIKTGQNLTVLKRDIEEKYNGMYAEYGDLDNIVIERALNLAVKNRSGKDIEMCDYNTIADVLFGNSNVYCDKNLTFSDVEQMFIDKNKGIISNFIVGTADLEDENLGIIKNHAYSVKSVGANYVEVVNPWDNNDSIKLTNSDFEKYFKVAFVFGQTSGPYKGNGTYTNTASSATEQNITLNANPINSPYNYYIDLYDMLTSSGMSAIPAGMENSTVWLANVIQAGAVLKIQDSNNNWIDTSVATDTRLQEVSDTTLLKKAEAKYEADMKKIDRKERKYDADLATFDNERNAIKQEMDTLKNVAKDNVERTFKLFS